MSASSPRPSFFIIDTHLDTPTASMAKAGWDFGARHDYAVDGTQCDLPRMVEGGLDAVVLAAYVGQAARSDEGHAFANTAARKILERARAAIAANTGACGLALSADDALRLKAEGKRAIFLSIENSYSLGRDRANVQVFYDLGVRMIGLTHMLNNEVADASTDARGPEWGGLSPFGREVVAECNRIGIVLDASHASDAATDQLIALSRTPVVLSHSGCRAVCDHPRNVGDDLLRRLAAKGGVLQMNALPVAMRVQPDQAARTAALDAIMERFRDQVPTPEVRAAISKAWDEYDLIFAPPTATMDDYVRHVLHAVKVIGADHVGIGCDLDGGGGFEGVRAVSDYPKITAALRAAGLSDADLEKIWGANTLRVLRAVEASR